MDIKVHTKPLPARLLEYLDSVYPHHNSGYVLVPDGTKLTRRCSGEAERTVELKSGWVSFLRVVSIELEKVSLEIEKASIEFEKASSKFEKVSIEFEKVSIEFEKASRPIKFEKGVW